MTLVLGTTDAAKQNEVFRQLQRQYNKFGDKMTEIRQWIFIRGLARHSRHWDPFVTEFRKHFPQDQIELLDLRGNGSLAHSPSYLSIADNVRDLKSRSYMVKNGKPVHLMTISLGSMIGVEWSRLFPEEVAALITINTSDKGTSQFFERMRPKNYPGLLKIVTNPKNSALAEEPFPSRGPSPGELSGSAGKNSGDSIRQGLGLSSGERSGQISEERFSLESLERLKRTTTRRNFLRQLMAAGSYQFPKQKPKPNILMLCSEQDPLVNSQCTYKIADMWKVHVRSHPRAGHDLPLDDAPWVCEEIGGWLKLHPSRA